MVNKENLSSLGFEETEEGLYQREGVRIKFKSDYVSAKMYKEHMSATFKLYTIEMLKKRYSEFFDKELNGN